MSNSKPVAIDRENAPYLAVAGLGFIATLALTLAVETHFGHIGPQWIWTGMMGCETVNGVKSCAQVVPIGAFAVIAVGIFVFIIPPITLARRRKSNDE